MRGAGAGLALGAWLLASPGPAAADVADYLGREIVAVRLTIEGRPADSRLHQVVQTRTGEALSMEAVRESLTHLFSLGRFESVVAHAAAEGRGVALLYELVPRHPVTEIRFAGPAPGPGVDVDRLRTAVGERFGPSPSVGQAADIAALVEDRLRERGYLSARAVPRIETRHAPEGTALVYDLDPGVRVHIAGIQVSGTPGQPTTELLDELDLAEGMAYERTAIAGRVERYLQQQRNRGFYNARLTLTPRLVDSERRVDLAITVDRGPRVRVVFRGDPLPAARRDDLVPVAAEGSTDEDLLEDSRNNIESYLRAQGYRDAAAPYTRETAGGELLLTFTLTRGPLYRVASVDVTGYVGVPLSAFAGALTVTAGRPFSAALVAADAEAIENYYRRQGYANVNVRTEAEPVRGSAGPGDVPVAVRLHITENVRTVVTSVSVQGNASVEEAGLIAGLGLQPGSAFFLTQMAIDRDALQLQYANRGFLSATIDANPGLSPDLSRADLVFTVREGPRLFVDHVLIAGNERIRSETITREVGLRSGDPLSLAAVTEGQRRLAALGLFRRARITQLAHGEETRRDLLIVVEEAPATTAGYGGGIEAGRQFVRTEGRGGSAANRVEVAPRAFFEIGRRNLFGKNRSINLFTGVSLVQRSSATFVDEEPQVDASGFSLSEYRVLGTFREPRVLGTAADAVLTGTAEQQRRSSFYFRRHAFGAEAGRRLSPRVSASGSYQIQRTEIFNEQISPAERLLVDRLFPQVRLSSFTASGVFDSRDDPLDPAAGHYVSGSAQLAARRLGSEVGFVKSYYTGQVFRTLPRTNRTVFVGSARIGLAAGFPRDVGEPAAAGAPRTAVRDLPASERFFAGGDTTVRGFVLDQLGPRQDGFPYGGNALVILNAELRVPVRWGLGVVGFVDAGNVFARTADIDFAALRTAVGFGFRYRSPVGPIRFDVGFNVDRGEFAEGQLEPLTAIHISLGQAF